MVQVGGIRRAVIGLVAGLSLLGMPALAQNATPEVTVADVSCFPGEVGGWLHPYAHPQTDEPGETFNAVIEISQGDFNKYEYNEHGFLILDRVQTMPVWYPGNYGSIPSSAGGDGDPLDVLVLSRIPILPGTIVEVRAIGLLHMIDDGELDDKVLAVPATDPDFDHISDLSDIGELELQRIEQFFAVYKNLPTDRKPVELNGFSDATAASAEVVMAIENYTASCN